MSSSSTERKPLIIHEDPIGTDPPTQRSCFADDHEHEPDPADAVIVPMSRNVRIGLYAAVVVLLILTIVFWASVDSLLRELRTAITSLGDFWGAFAIAWLVFLVSLPIPGYVVVLLLAGYIYKFSIFIWFATCIGAMLGASATFLASRWMFRHHVNIYACLYCFRSMIRATRSAIRTRGGLKMTIMIRMAPLPFGPMNVALSAAGIPFYWFLIATFLCTFEQLLWIYIGSTASDLADLHAKHASFSPLQLTIMIMTSIIGLAALIWLGCYVSAILREENERAKASKESDGINADDDDPLAIDVPSASASADREAAADGIKKALGPDSDPAQSTA